MENNYWIVDDWLIFKPYFKEVLDDYYGIINKYKKIIFSDYDEPLIAIETNNIHESEKKNNYIINNFYQKIDLSNNINLTHLTFGKNFNQEIFILLNVKSLTLRYCDDQYIIDNLHNNIEELAIYETNLILDNLPNRIKKLNIFYYKKKIK
jgi:hypothetical protein